MLSRCKRKLKEKAEEILLTEYAENEEYSIIEDLLGYIEYLEEEIKNIEQDREENYKPIIRHYED